MPNFSRSLLVVALFGALALAACSKGGKTADGEIVLADEISPDTCRFWDAKTNEKLDKDRFRRDLGGEEEAYQEVARRLGLLDTDNGPSEVLDLNGGAPLKRYPDIMSHLLKLASG